jgi:hypothetical protein
MICGAGSVIDALTDTPPSGASPLPHWYPGYRQIFTLPLTSMTMAKIVEKVSATMPDANKPIPIF